ncbi:hypothetical protein D3C81_1131040 [compost metagenome]
MADRVGGVENAFELVAFLEEHQPITVGGVGKRQGQLHFPFDGAIGRQPADALALGVRPDPQPLAGVSLGAFVHVEAAEGGLCGARGCPGVIAQFAARRGQHALEQGFLAVLQQGLVGCLQGRAERQGQQRGANATHLHGLSSS